MSNFGIGLGSAFCMQQISNTNHVVILCVEISCQCKTEFSKDLKSIGIKVTCVDRSAL